MAPRIRKIRHDENTRQKIRTSQLINRLENHILGRAKMTASAVTAALGLLRKTLPDLTAAQLSGPNDGPIRTASEGDGRSALEIVQERIAKLAAVERTDNLHAPAEPRKPH